MTEGKQQHGDKSLPGEPLHGLGSLGHSGKRPAPAPTAPSWKGMAGSEPHPGSRSSSGALSGMETLTQGSIPHPGFWDSSRAVSRVKEPLCDTGINPPSRFPARSRSSEQGQGRSACAPRIAATSRLPARLRSSERGQGRSLCPIPAHPGAFMSLPRTRIRLQRRRPERASNTQSRDQTVREQCGLFQT